VFLHGGGDNPYTFIRYGLEARLNEAVRDGAIPRVVMVFPQGDDGFWVNWYDGTRNYEDWIVDGVMNEVADRWHTAACPRECHVMGVSMGAHGALRFALHRPERFASVTALSGPIFDVPLMAEFTGNRLFASLIPMDRIFGPTSPRSRLRNEDFYTRWRSADDVGMPVFLSWGSNDRGGIDRSNAKFARHLREAGVPLTAFEYDGNHSWVSWTPVIVEALRVQVAGAELSADFASRPNGSEGSDS
ncbi:MAG: alpha/beta hydrolase-fold protein, partial [Myxococcota bacterium]